MGRIKLFRAVVASDFHFFNFPKLAEAGEHLLSSRCEDIGKVYLSIVEYCMQEDISLLILGGDIFHKQDTIEVPVFNYVSRIIGNTPSFINVCLLVGNHDQITKSGKIYSTESFGQDNVIVYGFPYTASWFGVDVSFVPYMERDDYRLAVTQLMKPKNKPHILVSHIGVEGALLGGLDVQSREPITLEDLHPEYFDGVVLGHYHRHQQLADNVWYTGAPLQHNFGDAGQERGFLDVSIYQSGMETIVETTFVPVEDTPKFHNIDVEEYTRGMFPSGDFVKLLNATPKDLREYADDPQVCGAKKKLLETPETRMDITFGEDLEVLVDKFVSYIKVDASSKERKRLKKFGKELLP